MTAVWGLAAIKLMLSVATFAALGYIGTYDKRIAGVLLTFPILNGIGILTAKDPLAAANSIYAVVVFNGLLLFVAISFYRILPPLPAKASPHVQLIARVVTWTLLWAAGAVAIVIWRDELPGPAVLLIVQCTIAVVATVIVWKPPFRSAHLARPGRPDPQPHAKALVSVWWTSDGLIRIGLFAFCCILLLVAANFYESKWVGMLSALPLPGLFAVATLSTIAHQKDLGRIRETVLWGPITVITFNWTFAEAIVRLRAAPYASWTGLALLVLLLCADAVLILWAVPLMAAYLDSRRMTTSQAHDG